jgi:hypothetical protein
MQSRVPYRWHMWLRRLGSLRWVFGILGAAAIAVPIGFGVAGGGGGPSGGGGGSSEVRPDAPDRTGPASHSPQATLPATDSSAPAPTGTAPDSFAPGGDCDVAPTEAVQAIEGGLLVDSRLQSAAALPLRADRTSYVLSASVGGEVASWLVVSGAEAQIFAADSAARRLSSWPHARPDAVSSQELLEAESCVGGNG